jgi:hypothetical protein
MLINASCVEGELKCIVLDEIVEANGLYHSEYRVVFEVAE